MRKATLSALGVAWCLSACGPPYGKRVPDSLVEKLPYEMKVELLEAENNLGVELDKVDEAQNEILRSRDNIRRAKDRRSAAKDEVSAANDPQSKEVAELAVEEAQSRYDYLRARQKVNVELEDVEEMALRCAFAEYEVARLTAARKAKVEGSEKYDPANFDQQVKDCKERVTQMKADMKDKEADMATAKTEWEQKKVSLAKKTFDARASPYVE
jgi:hypothetical protein